MRARSFVSMLISYGCGSRLWPVWWEGCVGQGTCMYPGHTHPAGLPRPAGGGWVRVNQEPLRGAPLAGQANGGAANNLGRRVETVRGCRVCANTQAKATPQAHRARRTIPLFTQLYVAACTQRAHVPPLRTSPQSFLTACTPVSCAVPARVVYFCVCRLRACRVGVPPTPSVFTHTPLSYDACVCGAAASCVASNLFDITPLAHQTAARTHPKGVHCQSAALGFPYVPNMFCVCCRSFTCCSGNSVGMESALD